MEELTLSVIIMAFQIGEICSLCWGERSDRTRWASPVSPVISVDAGEKNPPKKGEFDCESRSRRRRARISLQPVWRLQRQTNMSFCCCCWEKFPSSTRSWQNFWCTQRKFRVMVHKRMSQWPPVSTEVMISPRVSLTQWHHGIGAVDVNRLFVEWNTPSHKSSARRRARATRIETLLSSASRLCPPLRLFSVHIGAWHWSPLMAASPQNLNAPLLLFRVCEARPVMCQLRIWEEMLPNAWPVLLKASEAICRIIEIHSALHSDV